jgi:hypothetical protein
MLQSPHDQFDRSEDQETDDQTAFDVIMGLLCLFAEALFDLYLQAAR